MAGVHSALAPASTSTAGVRPRRGSGVAMQGRTTPGSRPMRSSAEAMVAPVLPGRHHGGGLPVAHELGGPDQGGVLLAAHPAGRVLVHADDLGAGQQLQALGVADQLGRADEDDADAVLLGGPAGALDDFAGGQVAAHGVDGNGQRGQRLGAGTLAPAAQVSRPRPLGAPCTSRSWGRPRGASWTPGSAGTRCGRGRSRRQAPARWLRPLALDFFFLGTAMAGLQRSIRAHARSRTVPDRERPATGARRD